jgi:hypothetical protein
VLFFALANILFAQDFSAKNNKYSPSIYGDKFTYEEDKFYYFNELSGVLFLKGKIEKGMYKDFRQAITDNNIQTLVLDSPGGSVSEGLRIAGTVFDRKIKTYIRKNQNCASACSFIFLSGKTRYTLGKLGVHQIAFGEEFSKKKEEVGVINEVVQLTNSDIVQYLNENNTPGFVYVYMLRTPSDEMYYFNEDELNQLGNSDISNQDRLDFNRIDNFIIDYNSHLIENKCDTDPNSCTTTQLCSRASKNNKWKTSPDAARFVEVAKSKGKRCGVPDPICPENIKKCNKEYLCTYGTTGIDSGKSWLNNSSGNEAKLRGYSCGIISKPVTKTGTLACDDNPLSCTSTQLCQTATKYITTDHKKIWQTFTIWKPYVSEAKRRGLTCGVSQKQTCYQDAKECTVTQLCTLINLPDSGRYITEAKRRELSCGTVKSNNRITCSVSSDHCSSDAQLCQFATMNTSKGKEWKNNSYWLKHVAEAKRRGLTCGIITVEKMNSSQKMSLQASLNALGCQAGSIDGVIGSKTIAALKRWKASGGNYKNEIISLELLKTLRHSVIKCPGFRSNDCNLYASQCTSERLCILSVKFGSTPKQWTKNSKNQKYIREAKKRGLSCGVR